MCMREWRVSSSEREKRFSQAAKVHTKGFSPVCVRMWRGCGAVRCRACVRASVRTDVRNERGKGWCELVR